MQDLSTSKPTNRIALPTGLAIGVYGMQATMLGTLMPGFAKILTPSESGQVAASQSLALILGSLLTGPVIDRFGAKPGIIFGMIVLGAAMAAIPLAHTYWPILLAMALLGLGGGIIATGSNTMASTIGGANKARMLNLLNVFFGIGGLTTPALGAAFTTETCCRIIVLLCAAVLVYLAVTPVPLASQPTPGPPFEKRLLLRPVFLLLCVLLFCYVGAEVSVWNWLAAYLTGRGIDKSTALRVLSLGFATGLISGRLAASALLTKLRPARVTLASSVLMVVFTLAVLSAATPLVAGIVIFCAGVAMSPVYPTVLGMIAEEFPRGTGTAIGIAVMAGCLGVAASSSAIGAIAGTDPHRLGTALLVIPGVSFLMVVVNVVIAALTGRRESTAAAA